MRSLAKIKKHSPKPKNEDRHAVDGFFMPEKRKKMRYPNTRYGNLTELQYYAQGIPKKELAKMLRRDQKTIYNWLSGAEKIPWLVPEVLRLWHNEKMEMARQMGYAKYLPPKFNVISLSERTIKNGRPSTRPGSDPDNTERVIAPSLKAV